MERYICINAFHWTLTGDITGLKTATEEVMGGLGGENALSIYLPEGLFS